MKRRHFLRNTTLTGGALALGGSSSMLANETKPIMKHKFNLHYAPHLGMFKHHAGDDPIDQLNFMADQGFTAFEDNGMRSRDIELQKKM